MTALQAVPDDEDGPRYDAMQVCELAGVTYRQIDYWTRGGLLGDPQLVGSGHSRTYSFDEIELLRLVKPLLDHGVMLRPAFDIARQAIATGKWSAPIADVYEITVRVTQPEGATT